MRVFSSVFGTAKATQEADNLIILQRGKKHRFLDIKKNRFDGELGIVPYRYDKASGRVRPARAARSRPASPQNPLKRLFLAAVTLHQIIEVSATELAAKPAPLT